MARRRWVKCVSGLTHRTPRIILPIFLLLLTVVSMTNMRPVFASPPPSQNFFSGWAGLCTGGTNCVTAGGADHSNGFTCTASTCTGLGQGSGDGQFDTVNWVGVEHSGNVYVSDYQNARVDEFSGGVFVG